VRVKPAIWPHEMQMSQGPSVEKLRPSAQVSLEFNWVSRFILERKYTWALPAFLALTGTSE